MITHKDRLQNQIKKLQSLINDISESELEEKLSIGGGVIVDLTCDSINTYSINTNSLLINGIDIYDSFSDKALNTANITNSDTITTKNLTVSNKLTSNYDLTCYNIFSTNINNVHGITSDYLETNNLTLNNTQLCIYQLSFNVIYNGTASSRGKIMMEFNNIAGLCYDARFDAIELIGCVKEIDNTKFGITNTYKCSVGIDINNLMKCTAYFPPDYTAKVVPIKYIVGTFYSEHSPSSIYQYATGYGDSNQLMRGDNIRFPVEHAVFCFKYISIDPYA